MKILIVFSTQTGTTQMAADHLMKQLSGHEVRLVHASQANLDEASAVDLLVVATPNYDGGMPEAALIPFLKAMRERTDVTGKAFAVLNLADSGYPDFGTAGPKVVQALEAAGMVQKGETLTIDQYMYNSTEANGQIEMWGLKLVEVNSA